MSNLTKIKIHGVLAEQLGQSEWKLAVNSVGEAIGGVQANSKKLYQSLIKNDQKNIKYRVLVNQRDLLYDTDKDINSLEGIASSELVMNKSDLKTIDIVPVIEGADEVLRILVGIALIAGAAMMPGGLAAVF